MAANRAPGQRVGLTRQAVLEGAIRLADREGLAALSMRRLGAELGVEAMTLYHHVPNKAALLDGVVEQIVAGAVPPEFGAATWQDSFRHYAEGLAAALRAHPHALPLLLTRPAVTPRNAQTMEAALDMLHQAGFPLGRALDLLYCVTGYVVGQAAVQAGEVDWDAADIAAVDPEAHPLLVEAAGETGEGEARFRFGLEALLAGFAGELAAIRRESADGRDG